MTAPLRERLLAYADEGDGRSNERPYCDDYEGLTRTLREAAAALETRAPEEHEPGCPAIADDESDQVLYDYGECVCRASRIQRINKWITDAEEDGLISTATFIRGRLAEWKLEGLAGAARATPPEPPAERDSAMMAVAMLEWARLIRLAEDQQTLLTIAEDIEVNARALAGDLTVCNDKDCTQYGGMVSQRCMDAGHELMTIPPEPPACAKCRQPKVHPFHAPKGLFGGELETHPYEPPATRWLCQLGAGYCNHKQCEPPAPTEPPRCADCGKNHWPFYGCF